ncbi:cytochrome b [Altererythrobacter salegens]|uniref:Cytochrome b n=1 Tax=Croceibacterium salegens TaxID=1737568 RepID=A0A6I4SVQ1_9SPHN|nr:cytochrome b [Croceibacterium salegens]MXO60115.1 cytochrome b [Croceibacterium salegens]
MPVTRYSKGAMLLHWLIAIAVIVNWRLAEAAEHVPHDQHLQVLGPHMATGILILVLSLIRLGWRFTHAQPPLGSHLPKWEVVLARVVHVVFYVAMIGLPLMGWIGTSMQDHPIDFFGWFTVPMLPIAKDDHGGHELLELHGTFGNIFIYLIGLHILGALKHHFWDKDGELWRMLPFGQPRQPEA